MSRQILFCVESNNKARTDYQYIEETLKRFYKVDRKIRYRAIYLGSKTKYNAKDKVREINKNIIKYEVSFDNEIITMTYSNNMYTFNYKEDDKVIYTGTITIDRNDSNITTYFNTTYITDKENIKTNIVIKTSDTLNIELFDTTNSININDISDKEMNNILNNILNNDAVKSILNNEEVSNYIKEKNA